MRKIISLFILSIYFLYFQLSNAMHMENIKNKDNDSGATHHFLFDDPFGLDLELLATMSAPAMRAYLKSKNVEITKDSYMDHVLCACETIDNIFKNPQTNIFKKLQEYEELITNHRINGQKNLFLQDVGTSRATRNIEFFLSEKEHISKIITAFSFANYIYNPFEEVQNKFSIIFHQKNNDNAISFGDNYVCSQENNDNTISFGNNYVCFNNEKYIFYANRFGYECFTEISQTLKEEHPGVDLTNLQKNGLFNLLRHYIPLEGKKWLLLDHTINTIQKDYKNGLLAYRYFLKPLVGKALHPSFNDIALLENAFRHCMYYALDNRENILLHLDNLASKLHQDSNTNSEVKEMCQIIKTDIGNFLRGEELKSHISFWAFADCKNHRGYVQDTGSFSFTKRAEFIFKQNGFKPSDKLSIEISYLKSLSFDFRSAFQNSYNLPTNVEHEYFRELDEYFEQTITFDPINIAEKQYKILWWHQLMEQCFELVQKHAGFLLPKLHQFTSEHLDWFRQEKDPVEQLKIKELIKKQDDLDTLFYMQYCKNSFLSDQFFGQKRKVENQNRQNLEAQFYYNVGKPTFQGH